jgi:hypothetical protein
MRKIIQLATTALPPRILDGIRHTDDEFVVTALCDDGTAWYIQPDHVDANWQPLPPIPRD